MGDTVTEIELTPVPDIVTVMVLFFPPELWVVTTIEPLSVPADGGVNMTVPVTLCPPARVMG